MEVSTMSKGTKAFRITISILLALSILSIALLCTSKKVLFGDTLDDISQLTYKSFCRKTKPGYKRLKALISPNAEIYDYRDIANLILKILCIIEYEGDSVTFSIAKLTGVPTANASTQKSSIITFHEDDETSPSIPN